MPNRQAIQRFVGYGIPMVSARSNWISPCIEKGSELPLRSRVEIASPRDIVLHLVRKFGDGLHCLTAPYPGPPQIFMPCHRFAAEPSYRGNSPLAGCSGPYLPRSSTGLVIAWTPVNYE